MSKAVVFDRYKVTHERFIRINVKVILPMYRPFNNPQYDEEWCDVIIPVSTIIMYKEGRIHLRESAMYGEKSYEVKETHEEMLDLLNGREYRCGHPVITQEEATNMDFPYPPEDKNQNVTTDSADRPAVETDNADGE